MLYYIGFTEFIVGVGFLIKSIRFFATFANLLLLTWGVTATLSAGMYFFAIVPFVIFIISFIVADYYDKNIKIANINNKN